MNRTVLTFCCLLLGLTAGAQLSELPITLSLPFDEDTIEETEPTFIWQSNLSALQTDPRLSQRLTVVKLLDNQTALEGLAVNNPVFLRENLTSSTLPYSGTDHALENNTWYAWQVSYLMNGMVIGQSDAWRFIRVEPAKPVHPVIQLRRQSDLSFYTINEPALYFSSDESGDFSLKGILRDESGNDYPVDILETVNGEVVQGGNEMNGKRYFMVDFETLNLKSGKYTFYWKMDRSRTRSIQLIFRK